VGIVILNDHALGLSREAEVAVKSVHAYIGYVFALNLLWRLVWAFIGNAQARWKALLPFKSGFVSELRQTVRDYRSGSPPAALGHNPLARLMVTGLLIVLVAQAGTGLILAGTDLYKPPLGHVMAKWATGDDPEKLAHIQPGSKDFVDPTGYEEMRAFRQPVKEIHEFAFYLLLAMVLLHVIGAIATDVRFKQAIISAMFTGHKAVKSAPNEAEQVDARRAGPNS
jgi:cytochrome b